MDKLQKSQEVMHDIPYLGVVEAVIRCPRVDMINMPVVLLMVLLMVTDFSSLKST